jgi:hypothetical protein
MRAEIIIEYINGDTETVYCDDYSESKTSLIYYIRSGMNGEEHHIPFSSVKKWTVRRF